MLTTIFLYKKIERATFHNNSFYGEIPTRMCNLFKPRFGVLKVLTADCDGDMPKVKCDCCTACY